MEEQKVVITANRHVRGSISWLVGTKLTIDDKEITTYGIDISIKPRDIIMATVRIPVSEIHMVEIDQSET